MALLKFVPRSDESLCEHLYPAVCRMVASTEHLSPKLSELRHYLERLQDPFDTYNLLERMDAGVCLFESPGRFVYANEKTCESLGWDKHELLGRHWFDFIDRDYQHLIAANRDILFNFGRINWIRYVMRDRQSQALRVRCKAKLVFLDRAPLVLCMVLWEHYFRD